MRNYKKSEPGHSKLPEFNPEPSGRFVSRIFKELNISGALIGRLAVWAWLPDTKDHAFTKDFDVAVTSNHVDIGKLRDLITKFLGPLGRSYLEILLASAGHEAARLVKYKRTS